LFGAPAKSNDSLEEDFNDDIPQLSHDENSILITKFSEKEVLEVIEQMEKNQGLMASLLTRV
jgi:hypothetical protein